MRLLAALATGVAVGAAVALALGILRPPRRPSRDPARRDWFTQAGVVATPLQFWLVSGGAGLLTLAGVALLTGSWAVAAFPSLLMAMLPRLYFASQRRRRLGEVRQAWPDGLRDLVASISAGRSLRRGIEDLASSGPLPLRHAFASFPFLARSLGVVTALERIRDEVADPTTDRVIEVLIVAHERGGAIVPDMPWLILVCILLAYAVLGMFMDAIGMLLLTLPVVYPAVMALNGGEYVSAADSAFGMSGEMCAIWFGILVVKMAEFCLITPPIGLNCFVVAGVRPDLSVQDVFRGVMPFFLADAVTIGLLVAFPAIVLWLPGLA